MSINFSFLQNPVERWGVALLVCAASIAALYGLRYFLLCRLRKIAARTDTRLDDFVVTVLSSTHTLSIWAVGIYLGSQVLELTPYLGLLVTRVALTALLLQLAVWGDCGLRTWRDSNRNGDLGRRACSTATPTMARGPRSRRCRRRRRGRPDTESEHQRQPDTSYMAAPPRPILCVWPAT